MELNSGNMLYHQEKPTGRTSGVGSLINKRWKIRIEEMTSISNRVEIRTLRLSKRYTIQI